MVKFPNSRTQMDLFWLDIKENVGNEINNLHFFNELKHYFIGLYNLVNGSDDFKAIETTFYEYLWLYGELFITKLNGEIQLWQINYKENSGIYVKNVVATLISENNPLFYNQIGKQVKFKNGVNGVYVKWDNTLLPAVVKYWEYCKKQNDFYKMFENSAKLSQKKFILNVNNDSENITNEEINSFLDVDTPFIKSINPMARNESDVQNLIEELKMGENNSQNAYDNLLNLRAFWKDIFGIVQPTDNKKERKNLTETLSENYSTENIETLTLKNLNLFAKKWNELFNDNLEFGETNDLLEIENDKVETQESERYYEDNNNIR